MHKFLRVSALMRDLIISVRLPSVKKKTHLSSGKRELCMVEAVKLSLVYFNDTHKHISSICT